MSAGSLRERLQSFRSSSSFAGGDPFSFSVVLGKDLRLPGKHDPVDYLQQLGLNLKGKRVCIICPANSGLCVEAVSIGAEVSAYEPRDRYHRAVDAINGFVSEVFDDGFKVLRSLDGVADAFDVVIWPEGVEDIRDPKLTIDAAVRALAPGGTFVLEISHGTAGVVPDRINSWRPSKDGLIGTLKSYPQLKILSEVEGRNQVRKIYTIKDIRIPEPVVHQRHVDPAAQPSIELLDKANEVAPSADTVTDIEYFRQKLMSSLAKMRETEKTDAVSPELTEVFERPAEPEPVRGSTPKSRRKHGKESKS